MSSSVIIGTTPGADAESLQSALTKINTNFTSLDGALALKADAAAIPSKLSALTNDSGFITVAGARSAISASGALAFDPATGVISYSPPSFGSAAFLSVGTAVGTVAAGNDSRITGAAQKSSNLSDLTNLATARTNLGVYSKTEVDTSLSGKASLSGATFSGTIALTSTADAVLQLETTAVTGHYSRKQIFSTINDGMGGDGWLFRSVRPSDSAVLNYTLGGASGSIYTSGNVDPAAAQLSKIKDGTTSLQLNDGWNWATLRGAASRLVLSNGSYNPVFTTPGGGGYGAPSIISAIMTIPSSANSNLIGATPGHIICAPISGSVINQSNKAPAVALFGMARAQEHLSQNWGANLVVSNWPQSDGSTATPYKGNFVGLEIDMGWKAPQAGAPTGGSNVDAIWIPSEFVGSRPDGEANALHVGIYGDQPWRNAIKTDHGCTDQFAQIGMLNKQGVSGASGSQTLRFISTTNGTDNNAYKHSFIQTMSDGSFLFQPNYFAGSANLIVANNDLSQACYIHPSNGFSGPSFTVNTGGITGNLTVSGNGTFGTLSSGIIELLGGVPSIRWRETDAGANNNNWDILSESSRLYFRCVNDAYNSAISWMYVDRSQTTPVEVNFTCQTFTNGNVMPRVDNSFNSGHPSFRWANIYAGSGTIITSDAREKTSVAPLTDTEIAWARDLAREIGSYQFIGAIAEKGDAARHHIGMTVQRAIELGLAHGLDPMAYAFICYDTWEATDERPAGDRYSFRADQLALFIARGQEAAIAAQAAEIARQNDRLAVIEARLGS
jgi:hypothetical protein